jgi:hypothetical protein
VTTTIVTTGPSTVTQVGTHRGAGSRVTSCTAKRLHVWRARRVTITCRFTAALLAQLAVRSVRIRIVTKVRTASGRTFTTVRLITLHRRVPPAPVTG